jgi:asparagine synthase (glutamine-hydrolysing)
MCGIAGILSLSGGPPVDRRELETITASMQHRGPDGSGIWIAPDGKIGLGHRRLAFLDLTDAGAQPMASASSGLQVTFNGEIYNYPELRASLEARGIKFRSHCDTEVLLHLYELYGDRLVDHLRGMFAFAIWDSRQQRLFLAKDPFGIKPLYWSFHSNTFRFASEVRALMAGGAVPRTISAPGIVGFLSLGYVPDPFTTFDSIHSLPAGHTLCVTERGVEGPKPYYSVASVLREAEETNSHSRFSETELIERIREALSESTRSHLLADVPIGVFLSGGVDSSAVASFAVSSGRSDLQTVTLGFDAYLGRQQDETGLAGLVARELGTRHTTRVISEADFSDSVARILTDMDQPSIDGVNSWLVSKIAAEAGLKGILSGIGGDELFASYPSFRSVPLLANIAWFMPAPLTTGRWFRLATARGFSRYSSPKYASLFEFGSDYSAAYFLRRGLFMPWELPGIIDPELAKQGWDTLTPILRLKETITGLEGSRTRVSALELQWYMRSQLLRDMDWASMAHSLEVRTPLVDRKVFAKLAPLLVSTTPPVKSHVLRGLPQPLSSLLFATPKKSFVVPIREWLMQKPTEPHRTERGLRGWARIILGKKLPDIRLENCEVHVQPAVKAC